MSECRPTSGAQLRRMQGWPLKAKVYFSKRKIEEFVKRMEGNVYVSFSGGKDSTVLLHLVRSVAPSTPGVFFNTGLEFPEVRGFIKTVDNVEWINPTMSFKGVLNKYGYPVVSKDVSQKVEEIRNTKSDKLREKRLWGDEKGNGKIPEKWKGLIDAPFAISHKCCDVMKKNPAKRYERKTGLHPITGLMAEDSSSRTVSYLRRGCNAFYTSRPMSTPMGFWTTEDVWRYIRENALPYSPLYDTTTLRSTGCIFCPFGVHHDGTPNRFEILQKTHPRLWRYCMSELGMREVLSYLNVPTGGENE